jgi:type IV pilus assembly protein PilX
MLTFQRKQHGATLIVSLVILLSLTMLGITSMKGTTTEIAMAGNLRESAITFQAAEAGLNEAESILAAGGDPVNMIAPTDTDPDYFLDTTWDNATESSLTLAGITNNPRYIVKSLGIWNPDSNVSSLDPGFSGYGQTSSAKTVSYYRATSRGFGVTGKTYRTVQSFYGR